MKVDPIEINGEEAQALLERVQSVLTDEDFQIIKGLVNTHLLLGQAVREKTTSIKRLLKMIFGIKTEKKRKKRSGSKKQKGEKAQGHGRKSAKDYTGAGTVAIEHQTLQHCDPCPACEDGRLYRQQTPGVLVRITGCAPLQGTIYEMEKLRCNICGKIFTADPPPEAGTEKYDKTASAMLAVLRYGSGLPLYRLAGLQANLGIPLAASTAWDLSEKLADRVYPAFDELVRKAAQGEIFHNDDTTMKVLEMMGINTATEKSSRTGIFTTGIMSIRDNCKIAIFFTGGKHAGENLASVLAERRQGLDPPIQMCDALSRNTSEDFQTILANCLTHGRRYFVEVSDNFPDECEHVLEILGEVYHNEATAVKKGLTPAQRLNFHKKQSKPLMDDLHQWLEDQLEQKNVEPNSGLGKAIKYMLKHWEELTLFLRVEKAPLDNNICERALKKAILHRKNSLFYKTAHGAYIGDLFMSLIHTCSLAQVNPFEYLTALQKDKADLFANPHRWLPWNFHENFTSPAP